MTRETYVLSNGQWFLTKSWHCLSTLFFLSSFRRELLTCEHLLFLYASKALDVEAALNSSIGSAILFSVNNVILTYQARLWQLAFHRSHALWWWTCWLLPPLYTISDTCFVRGADLRTVIHIKFMGLRKEGVKLFLCLIMPWKSRH
jgi:hypothetical protein